MRSAILLRENTAALETRDATPRTFDAAANTVEAAIATETAVPRRDVRGEFLEILLASGLDLEGSRGAAVLNAHRQDDLDSVLGTVDTIRIEGGEVIGLIRFSTRPDVQPIIEDVRSGISAQWSAGYQVDEWREGTDAQGRRTKTAVRWRIREVSLVPVGADRNARTRSGRGDVNRTIRVFGHQVGLRQAVIDNLIDRELDLDEAREALMHEMISRGAVNIRSAARHNSDTVDNPEVFQRAAAEGLYMRILPSFQPPPMARQYVGLSCGDMARECLRRAGISITGLSAPALITRALESTSDYPLIMANVMNKSLRDAYAQAPGGIRQIARETTANDFRAKSRIQLDHSGFTLEKTTETGEFRHGGFVDSAESYAVDSYGKIFSISRKALVNDDLGALGDVTRRLGLAAAEFERQKLVDLLVANAGLGPTMSDGEYVFATAHGNVAGLTSGDGAPPSETTLSAARLAMRDQVGPGGGLISVVPRFLVVPSELETSSEKLITAIQATQTANVNPFAFLDLIVEPRLTDPTRWYVAADPALMPCLEFAYLAGAPGPQTESRAGFEVDGVQFKVRLDYGAGIVEHRGLYSNGGK